MELGHSIMKRKEECLRRTDRRGEKNMKGTRKMKDGKI
jgi:hypothetical protein